MEHTSVGCDVEAWVGMGEEVEKYKSWVNEDGSKEY